MELDDIQVSLKEDIQESEAVVIGVELLHDVDKWFGTSKIVATISAEIVCTPMIHSLMTLGESRANFFSNKLPFRAQIIYHWHSTSTATPHCPSFRS
jgi:hypothetical protein